MRNKYAELLMTTVANAHLWHFYTKSFAQHAAFGTFYEDLQSLADTYIEGDIGVNGPLVPTSNTFHYLGLENSIQGITALKSFTKVIRDDNDKLSEFGLVASLENIMILIDQTLFKLKQLS